MLKIKRIKPMFNRLVTTCDKYEGNQMQGGVIVKTGGTVKEYQMVEEVGPSVRDIKVGDIVMINPKRYAYPIHNEKRDSLKSVIKDNLEFGVSIPTVEYGGKTHLLIYDQDVDYIVEGEEVEDEKSSSSKLILPREKKILA